MLISFSCDQCGRRYRVDQSKVGLSARCRDCGAELRVPLPGPQVEETPSGGQIYRHQPRQRDFELAIGDSETIEAINAHVEQHLGPIQQVWHELVSDLIHIDVHEVAPSDDRPFWTLVTTGMSDRDMTVPEGAEDFSRAELVMCLPPDWALSQDAFQDERNYWPIRLLKVLARLPHEYETWLGPGHTVPHGGEQPVPYANNTKFCCALLVPPIVLLPAEFANLQTDNGQTINFYCVWPLYREEVDFKLSKGLDPLLDRLEQNRVTELLDINRVNVCQRPWWKFW